MLSKPTFVLVPGAWHPSTAYSAFLSLIHKAGYPAVAVDHPSLNSQDVVADASNCRKDVASIRQRLLHMMDNDGKDIIMLCHSYGGVPGEGAARGLSKMPREKRGLAGCVIGLVYMSAFVVPEGQSLLAYVGGEHPPYVQQHQPSHGLSTAGNARITLYNDVDPTTAVQLENQLLPHALNAFDTPAPQPAWAESDFAGKIAFLRCTQDQALPVSLQEIFTENSGVTWRIEDIDAFHSPWASRPEKTIRIFEKWAREFEDEV